MTAEQLQLIQRGLLIVGGLAAKNRQTARNARETGARGPLKDAAAQRQRAVDLEADAEALAALASFGETALARWRLESGGGLQPVFVFEAVQAEHLAWCAETFPGESMQSIFGHFVEEVHELAADPSDADELADCLLLLISLAEVVRLNPVACMARKLAINKKRKWNGIHHVKEAPTPTITFLQHDEPGDPYSGA